MAFNWFFAIGRGKRLIFKERSKPIPHLIQLSTQYDGKKMDELARQVKKLDSRQDEMVMAVEDLIEGLQEQNEINTEAIAEKEKEINALVSAMIVAADYTEDFYNYAKEAGSQEILEQARFFWNALNKKFSSAGLTRIADENTSADPVYNHISAVEFSDEISKPGVITKTLRSGYVYRGKVIRKSEVVVSKAKGDCI